MSIKHLPKPASILPDDISLALRTAVAHRFDATGRWISKPAADQRTGVERIDKIVGEARKRYPAGFR